MSFLTTGSSNLRPIRRLEGPLGHPTHDTGNPTSFNLLDIEDSVLRVHSSLVLGGLTDQTLLVGERDERRGGVATLLVRNCAQKKIRQSRKLEYRVFYALRDLLISTLVPS